jgi:hypothetical protein
LGDHKHLDFDDIEKYMRTNSSDEFEEGFLDYFEECLDTCENCQNRFRTWTLLYSLARSTPEDMASDPDLSNTIDTDSSSMDSLKNEQFVMIMIKITKKYEHLNEENIRNIIRTGLSENKLKLMGEVAS